MNFEDLIIKTFRNEKNYKYREKYHTEYDKRIFKLFHYKTEIFNAEIINTTGDECPHTANKELRVKSYCAGTRSDCDAIRETLRILRHIIYFGGDANYHIGSFGFIGLDTLLYYYDKNSYSGYWHVIFENGKRDILFYVVRVKRFGDVLLLKNEYYPFGSKKDRKYYAYKVNSAIKNRTFYISESDMVLHTMWYDSRVASQERLPISDYKRHIMAMLL